MLTCPYPLQTHTHKSPTHTHQLHSNTGLQPTHTHCLPKLTTSLCLLPPMTTPTHPLPHHTHCSPTQVHTDTSLLHKFTHCPAPTHTYCLSTLPAQSYPPGPTHWTPMHMPPPKLDALPHFRPHIPTARPHPLPTPYPLPARTHCLPIPATQPKPTLLFRLSQAFLLQLETQHVTTVLLVQTAIQCGPER